MTEKNEFTKDTKQLIIEFIDNCRESFQRLEKLIRLNEDGLMKCFEWFEKSETRLNGLINLFDVVNKKQDGNSIRIEKLETHIEIVHDLVNLEDRITASDVLCRLTLLENQCKNGYQYQKGGIDGLKERIKSLEFHKNIQIEENRKISRRIDEIENGYIKRIGYLGEALHTLSEENEKLRKIPNKCPVCNGKGFCNPCSGRGEFFTGNSPGATAICQYCRGTPLCIPCNGKGIV